MRALDEHPGPRVDRRVSLETVDCPATRGGHPRSAPLEAEVLLVTEGGVDDPKVYTKPFTVTLTESLEADTELSDEFCLEGEKDYDRLQRSRGK